LFFDFIELSGTLQEQAIEFLRISKVDIDTVQGYLLRFLDFHKERVRHKACCRYGQELL